MRRKIPSVSSLVALEAAARHQSFTKAAHELALTEGAVSRTINQLEQQLGMALFTRVNRRVVITPEGQLYSQQVKKSLAQLEKDTLAIMTQGVGGGTLELAVLPTLATQWLIPKLPKFYKSHPSVTLNMGARTGMFLFEESEFDAAIHYGQPTWPGTLADHLFDEHIVAVCQPEWARRQRIRHVADLVGKPLLHSSTRPDEWRQWFDAMALPTAESMRGMRFELHAMLIGAAESGLGAALLPYFLVKPSLESGTLTTLGPVVPRPNSYYLVYPEAKRQYPPLEKLRSWLRLTIANDADNGLAPPGGVQADATSSRPTRR